MTARLARLKGTPSRLWPAVESLTDRVLAVGNARLAGTGWRLSVDGDGGFADALEKVLSPLAPEQRDRIDAAVADKLAGKRPDEPALKLYDLAGEVATGNLTAGQHYRISATLAAALLSRRPGDPPIQTRRCADCNLPAIPAGGTGANCPVCEAPIQERAKAPSDVADQPHPRGYSASVDRSPMSDPPSPNALSEAAFTNAVLDALEQKGVLK